MSVREPVLELRLHRLVVAVGALAAVLAVVGFFPGERVYDDSNNCLGRAFAFTTEHHHDDCTPSYDQLTETRNAGGTSLLAGLAIALLPVLVVVREPTRKRAWIWFAATPFALAGGVATMLAIDFRLDLFAHVEVLWPEHVVGAGAALLSVLSTLVLPLVLLFTPKSGSSSPDPRSAARTGRARARRRGRPRRARRT
ncbi:MAG: hypothetical protein ACM31C_03870 [Acidobacteriota bacterium]